MGESQPSSKSDIHFEKIWNIFHFLDRRTMLDERFLSVVELQERQQEIENSIKNIE